MDFRFLEFLKEIINDTLYASIAKLAIAFYLGKKFIEFLISGFNIAYKAKEKQNEYIELKKDVIDLKKDNLENKERDLKTHKFLEKLEKDLNTYKDKKHDIENEKTALIKTLERNNELNEKNTNLMEKIIKKL